MPEDVSILSEIDEALRADKLQLLWANHGKAIITFCAMLVLSTAGSVLWKNHVRALHEMQTSLLAKAADVEEDGKNDEALGYYKQVEDAGGSLSALATLKHAKLLVAMKQQDKALPLYQSLTDGKVSGITPPLRDFAKLQVSIIESNQAFKAGKSEHPAPVGNEDVFLSTATEISALDALNAGDTKTAAELLNAVLANDSAPYSQRVRASELLDSIKEHKK
jgi:hypothetical protein